MNIQHPMTRRVFIKTLACFTLSSAAVGAGLGGCRARSTSTPESYYADHRDEIIKENRKIFTAMRPLLVDKFGEKGADAISEATFRRLDTLLPDLPYIGGASNDLTANLVSSVAAMAFYQEMKARGVAAIETGRFLFQGVTAMYASDPMGGMMGRLANSDLAQDKLKKEAEASKKRAYSGDWVFDFVPGDEDIDFGIDYTECGICKYFKAQGAEEFTPYMCLLDVPIGRVMNTGLVRTQTLARGDGRCDFRYKTGRTVQVEWDPGYVDGGK